MRTACAQFEAGSRDHRLAHDPRLGRALQEQPHVAPIARIPVYTSESSIDESFGAGEAAIAFLRILRFIDIGAPAPASKE